MIELSVHNLTKFYGANQIFKTISFEVKTGERIGLIGKNGCGKTTILKIIMGKFQENNTLLQGISDEVEQVQRQEGGYGEESLEDAFLGEVHFRKGVKIGYLNQIPIYKDETKTIDVIRMAFQEVFALKKRLGNLEIKLQTSSKEALDKALVLYGQLSQEYELAGGYELETKIQKITEGLKIDEALKQRSFNSLSGGEKTRVILAKILLEEPDIMLLDEPTNHLDLETIEWLEEFLKNYKGSVLVISHDRFFLDHVVTKIVELEFQRADIYMGNYSYYVLEKERRFLIEYKNYVNQQKKIERMEMQIKRYRMWGNMRDSETMFRRAKELEKRLKKVELLNRPQQESRKVRFCQENTNRSGEIVLETKQIKKSYHKKELFTDVDMNIYYKDHVCIIGKNGCGKSTLLKLILGEQKPDVGVIKVGAQVHIGYLPQQVVFEDENLTILEYFSGFHNITYEEARNQLARALFMKEDVHKKIKFLSGGEKSRLRLCSLNYEKVNFMILDEPTNHLDMEAREALEETLKQFEGTLLFVSHDRYFINKVASKIMSFEQHHIVTYLGDYTYYQEELKKIRKTNSDLEVKKLHPKIEENRCKQAEYKTNPTTNHTVKKINSKKVELLEQEIESIEMKVIELEQVIEQNNSDFSYLEELFAEKETLQKQLDALYDTWGTYQ